MSEKLHKVLAETGIGSRRNMEEAIKEGRVSVDGKVAAIGDRVEGTETIRVDGRIIKTGNQEKPICRVLMYNKPEGQMCTRMDPQGRPTVFDRLPQVANGRWIYVGRLDVNTSGLLLLTTDGALSNALTHPSHEMERVYAVRVFGEVTREHIQQLTTNVELEDGPAHFSKVEQGGGEGMNKWFYVTLREGRKREVRRLWEALGLRVSRLKRIRYACADLGNLPEGGWRELNLKEVNALRKMAGLFPETRTALDPEAESVTSSEGYRERRQMQRAFSRYKETHDLSPRGSRGSDFRSPASRMRDAVRRGGRDGLDGDDFRERGFRSAPEKGGRTGHGFRGGRDRRDDRQERRERDFFSERGRGSFEDRGFRDRKPFSGERSERPARFARDNDRKERPVKFRDGDSFAGARADRTDSFRPGREQSSGKYGRSSGGKVWGQGGRSGNGERSGRSRNQEGHSFRDAPRKPRNAENLHRRSPARSSSEGGASRSADIDF